MEIPTARVGKRAPGVFNDATAARGPAWYRRPPDRD